MTQRSTEKRYIHLLQWRWAALVITMLAALLVELFEGHSLSLGLFLEVDVLLFVIVIPFTFWLLLTLLARNMIQRARSENRIEAYQQFMRQLEQRYDWGEIAQFATHFPVAFLPVDQASLFTYDHPNARLEFVTAWSAPNAEAAPPAPDCRLCYACLLPRLRRPARCDFASGSPGDNRPEGLCLPLACGTILVGLLRLHCRLGQSLSADQIEFLDLVAPELARALALSIAHPQQVAQARTQAQQAERRQIAYELHDTLAQHIGYLHLTLDRFANDIGLMQSNAGVEELERMRQAASDAYEIIRNNLSTLRTWQAVELTELLFSYAHGVARRTGLKIHCAATGTPAPLSPQVNQQVFSLVQEGLNNIEKHAQAQQVEMALNWSADLLQIGLADDGLGFDPQAAPAEGRYGLAMLRERVAALRGEMDIDSAPGRGATLQFHIPLRPPSAASNSASANEAVSLTINWQLPAQSG